MPSLLDGHVSTVIRFAACAFFRALPIFIVLIGMCGSNVLKCRNKKELNGIEIKFHALQFDSSDYFKNHITVY